MFDDHDITRRRIERVRRELITPNRVAATMPFDLEMWEVPDDADDGLVGEPVALDAARAATFRPVETGTPWGRPWGTAWFRLSATVPSEWHDLPIEAEVDLGFGRRGPGFMSEGLVWRDRGDGTYLPDRGLHPAAHTWRLADHAVGGQRITMLVEAAANPLLAHGREDPNSDRTTAGSSAIYRVSTVALVVPNPEVSALHHDLRVLADLVGSLDARSTRAREIWVAIARALDALRADDVARSAEAARAELAAVLARPATASAHHITAVGHAHIDSAWLWPIRETKRKCARTFSNVLRRMEVDPDLVFACSQAVQYEWMRIGYPSIFEEIRQRVAEGRWVPVGGNWVEADGNLTGGESLVRQFVHGQRYFREHFGVTCSEQWIPDVFGYPGSLPQICRLAGAERFLTQKMSWNRTNRFPHHTFWWEGIDGSRVFTHFPPVDTYNASMLPSELIHAEAGFAEAGAASRSLMPFGFGDGGGGPNRDMAERFARVRDLEGLPRVEMGTPAAFFDAAMAEYPDAPVWFGELYFEMHRGTYTSQARTKQGNRRCEALLREAELWSVAAFGCRETDGYPAAALDRIWKEVLLLQFHDILPGSSIAWVHREAEATHERLASELEELIETALRSLAVTGPQLVNSAPHHRREVVVVDDARRLEVGQRLTDGRVAVIADVAGAGIAPLATTIDAPVVTVADGDVVMDNGRLRVRFDNEGAVVSLFDIAGDRELIAAGGRGGIAQLHEDLPLEYDAWDIEEYYRRAEVHLEPSAVVEVVDRGPLIARVAVRWVVQSSVLTQTFELRSGSDQLDVEVELDWHEHDHLLKLAWPLDLLCGDVTRHIQYGSIRTPIHTNTSWDHARFEICAHHWLSASEGDVGVAILSDSRFGYDATRTRDLNGAPSTTLRLTAVKGARYPDPRADEGPHRFRYAVRPHGRDLAPVSDAGYALRHPMRLVWGDAPGELPEPVVASTHPGAIVEVAKAAEDGSGDLIVRLFEALGSRSRACVRFGRAVTGVRVVDLLEDERPGVPSVALETSDDGREVSVTLAPFQIVTLRMSQR